MDDKSFQAALSEGLKDLAARPRSVADLTARLDRKLLGRHPDPDERSNLIAGVIERLKEYGYINDERFAEQFAHGQLSRRALGKRRLEQSLARRQVGRETIRQALEEVFEATPEAEIMERAIAKHLQTKGLPMTPQAVKRLMDSLLRRGFPYHLIATRLRELARTAKLQAVTDTLEETENEE